MLFSLQVEQLATLQRKQADPILVDVLTVHCEQLLAVLQSAHPLTLQETQVELLTSEKAGAHWLQVVADVQVSQPGMVQLATQLPLTRE